MSVTTHPLKFNPINQANAMNPLFVSQHMPQRSPHPKRSTQKNTAIAEKPIEQPMAAISSSSFDAAENIKKPQRPLTAYHIYFQIEREFIIQSACPPGHVNADPNKSCLRDVPRRYRSISLLPDWFAGPGKRQKRKHRKSHGMIGFLELSRVISRRWATLDTSDPETKRFVTRIATRELEEYKLEVKEYKELLTSAAAAFAPVAPIAVPSSITPAVEKQPSPAVPACATMISPTASPRPHDDDYFAAASFCGSCDYMNDEIDYSICNVSNNGYYMPSPCLIDSATFILPDELSIYDPLFELEDDQYVFTQSSISSSLVQSAITGMTRCISPVSSFSSSDMNIMNVDNINVGDDDFLQPVLMREK